MIRRPAVNWHWYGPDGYRVMTHVRAGEATPYGLSYEVGPRTYYFNDGADVTLTVRRESPTGSYKVFQRYLTGGVDKQLAARINGITTRSVALVADIQGSTIKLLKDDLVTVDCDPSLTVRGPFGAVVTAQAGCGESAETGYAGASTPSSNGGYTYLRNRWYDPQTSRFLTQDPIGLAGGVNLYAYAGGNPVAFSDPLGLNPCPACRVGEGISQIPHPAARAAGRAIVFIGSAVGAAAAAAERLKDYKFVTYTRTNSAGQVYSGRTSGFGNPETLVKQRTATHDPRLAGFGPGVVDKVAPGTAEGYVAIRGREQQLIDANGGAMSDNGTSANVIRGVSKKNPLGQIYHEAANTAFGGELHEYTGDK